jgi:hypothetical protein
MTESQALKMLGFPDATRSARKVWAARGRLRLEWLQRSAEDKLVAERTAARKRIIDAIAKEH